jgi:hypothetical protein
VSKEESLFNKIIKKKLGLLKTLGAALPSTQFPPRAGVYGNKGLAGWNSKPDPKGFTWFKKAVFLIKIKKEENLKKKPYKFY